MGIPIIVPPDCTCDCWCLHSTIRGKENCSAIVPPDCSFDCMPAFHHQRWKNCSAIVPPDCTFDCMPAFHHQRWKNCSAIVPPDCSFDCVPAFHHQRWRKLFSECTTWLCFWLYACIPPSEPKLLNLVTLASFELQKRWGTFWKWQTNAYNFAFMPYPRFHKHKGNIAKSLRGPQKLSFMKFLFIKLGRWLLPPSL